MHAVRHESRMVVREPFVTTCFPHRALPQVGVIDSGRVCTIADKAATCDDQGVSCCKDYIGKDLGWRAHRCRHILVNDQRQNANAAVKGLPLFQQGRQTLMQRRWPLWSRIHVLLRVVLR